MIPAPAEAVRNTRNAAADPILRNKKYPMSGMDTGYFLFHCCNIILTEDGIDDQEFDQSHSPHDGSGK